MTEAKHKNVYTAIAAAQLEFGALTKGSVNPAFRSKYADLSDVVQAVAPALSKHGIAFVHYVDARDLGTGPEACMVTALVHGESDTRMECPVPLIVSKKDMQGFKSATTYAKRIGLESVTGIAADDDDGNAAAKAPPAPRAAKVEFPPDIEPDLPDFIKWCRDQHGGGQGFGEYVAKTFNALWNKKPSENQLRSAWDKNKASLEWLENFDKREHGHVVDGFETRMMELTKNYEKAAE